MNAEQLHVELLLQAGRLLLEYNESTEVIRRTLVATAETLTGRPCQVAIGYHGVAVAFAGESPKFEAVQELRYNTALQVRVHQILDQVRRSELGAAAALAQLRSVETNVPRHSRWLTALAIGLAAASLALLLGADVPAAAVTAVASGLGLLVRQELGKRHFALLVLPLTAAFLGAVLGGLAIRMEWTQSPELVLIVPALMLVPGPHLINGLLDLIDNHLPMSLARLGLAVGILLASALGIVLGIALTLPGPLFAEHPATGFRLNLFSDALLAGIATCGFAMFYNTAWRQLGLAVLGGMAGHGVRFLALQSGCWLEVATFLGGLTVGGVSAWMARSSRTPVAVIAFAGAVTMIPGMSLYRSLGGAVQLARLADGAPAELAARTLGNALQGGLVVSGLALGLILGARIVLPLDQRCRPPGASAADDVDAAARQRVGEDSDDARLTAQRVEVMPPGHAPVDHPE